MRPYAFVYAPDASASHPIVTVQQLLECHETGIIFLPVAEFAPRFDVQVPAIVEQVLFYRAGACSCNITTESDNDASTLSPTPSTSPELPAKRIRVENNE